MGELNEFNGYFKSNNEDKMKEWFRFSLCNGVENLNNLRKSTGSSEYFTVEQMSDFSIEKDNQSGGKKRKIVKKKYVSSKKKTDKKIKMIQFQNFEEISKIIDTFFFIF